MLLRQANSGQVVQGVNDGDALLWNAAAAEWFPGPAGAVIGGDESGATDTVAEGNTMVIITEPLSLTAGQAVNLFFETAVELQHSGEVGGQVSAWFEVLLDDAPLSIPIGAIVTGDATNFDPIVTVSFSGLFLIPSGDHALKVQCTAGPGTNAIVNPSFGEGVKFSRMLTTFFRPSGL